MWRNCARRVVLFMAERRRREGRERQRKRKRKRRRDERVVSEKRDRQEGYDTRVRVREMQRRGKSLDATKGRRD